MPQIRFVKNRAPIEVPKGSFLMEELLKAGLPVASSCDGDAVCGKCRIEIVEGWDNLSRPMGAEEIVNRRLRIKAPYRVSCQAQVLGDVVVDTTYW